MDVGKRADGYKEEEREREKEKKKQGRPPDLGMGTCGMSDAQEVFAPKSGCVQDGRGRGLWAPTSNPTFLVRGNFEVASPPNLVKSEPHV